MLLSRIYVTNGSTDSQPPRVCTAIPPADQPGRIMSLPQ
jgi:hypothetical protein